MPTQENREYFARHNIKPVSRKTNVKNELTDAQKRSLRAIRTDEGLCKFSNKHKVMVIA